MEKYSILWNIAALLILSFKIKLITLQAKYRSYFVLVPVKKYEKLCILKCHLLLVFFGNSVMSDKAILLGDTFTQCYDNCCAKLRVGKC